MPRNTVVIASSVVSELIGLILVYAFVVLGLAVLGCGDSSAESSATSEPQPIPHGELCDAWADDRNEPDGCDVGLSCLSYGHCSYCAQDCEVDSDCEPLGGLGMYCYNTLSPAGKLCAIRCMVDTDCPTDLGIPLRCHPGYICGGPWPGECDPTGST